LTRRATTWPGSWASGLAKTAAGCGNVALKWRGVIDTLSIPEAKARLENLIARAARDEDVRTSGPWETAIKVGLGKWPEAHGFLADFEQEMLESNYTILPITLDHVRFAGLMTSAHRDPFDRLLAAQAQVDGLSLVTADPKLRDPGAACLF
jgi:PIN domain nuclease of toxin-antitoxin system